MTVTTDRRPHGVGPASHHRPTAHPTGRDDADRVLRSTRALLTAFVVFTALATVSLLPMGGSTETTFAWTIASRPNASFLGAAYVAGFVLSVLALRRRRWSEIRVSVVTVTVFTVLTLVPTLLHLHKFHLMAGAGTARMAGWVWLVVYLIVPVAGIVVLVRQTRLARRSGGAVDRRERRVVVRPMPAPLAALLILQGIVMAAAAQFSSAAAR